MVIFVNKNICIFPMKCDIKRRIRISKYYRRAVYTNSICGTKVNI